LVSIWKAILAIIAPISWLNASESSAQADEISRAAISPPIRAEDRGINATHGGVLRKVVLVAVYYDGACFGHAGTDSVGAMRRLASVGTGDKSCLF
jgi:hypothetical protein